MTEKRKPRCPATNRKGGPCGRGAGHGTDHPGVGLCKYHGGSSPAGRKAAQRQMAETAVQRLALPRTVDADTALIEELHRGAGAVAWLDTVVAAKREHELTGLVGGGPDSIPRAEPVVEVRMWQEERDRLLRTVKLCKELGLAEREVRLAEQQGETLASVIRAIVVGLGHRLDDPVVRDLVRRELTVVTGA